jgi:Leucine-rich repeat (LRR) protein
MALNPHKILHNYRSKKLDKENTIIQLINIINNSIDLTKRIESIYILKDLGFKNERLFTFFESLMISDSNEIIRTLAVKIIKENYLDKAFEPMCWAYKHESSIKCLLYIISTLAEIYDPLVNQYLIKQLKYMEILEFRNYVFNLIKNDKIKKYKNKELANILKNYHIIKDFIEKFKRIGYIIKNGYISELDLSCSSNNIVNWNIIKKLFDITGFLGNLQKLDLKLNNLKNLPNSIRKLSSLKELDLSNNQLTSLPDSFSTIKSLKNLNLSHNNLKELPSNFGELKNLHSLNLSHNKLMDLQESFSHLQKLEYLNLHGNRLEKFPESLLNLHSLIHLEIGLNNINRIHKDIGNLQNLQKLCLGGNNIDKTMLHRLKLLKNLRDLDIYDNKLGDLPDSIGDLHQLINISLHNNQLKDIPNSFSKLQSLINLDLSWNDFKQIPDEIFQLKNLKMINFSGNKIKKIPIIFNKLKQLEWLNLSYNKIQNLPEILIQLKKQGIKIQI